MARYRDGEEANAGAIEGGVLGIAAEGAVSNQWASLGGFKCGPRVVASEA